nr:hypothetical protein [uncultured Parasutterella sp.]
MLGAFGASLIQRGSLRPHTTKILSYGYDIKDMLVEKAESIKEDCEDLAAEAKEQYEDRKESKNKPDTSDVKVIDKE